MVATAALIAAVIAITATGGGGSKPPPPARLPPLVRTFANVSIGVTGGLPADWSAVRGPGFVQLSSHDGKAIIEIAAQSITAGSNPPLLRTALASIRKTYGASTVKHAIGARLGGLPARSVVVYARNRHHVPIRVLVAAALARRLAYVLEAFTSRSATVHDLTESQQIVFDLRLRG